MADNIFAQMKRNEAVAPKRMPKTIAMINMIASIIMLGCIFIVVDSLALAYRTELQVVIASAVFFYIWALIVLYRREGRIGYFWILLLVSFPFFFGQQVLGAFDIKTTRIMINIGQLSDSTVWCASFFVLACVLTVCCGYLFLRDEACEARPFDPSPGNESLRKACICLFVILLLPTVVYLVSNVSLSASLGYGARIDPSNARHGVDNIVGILAQLMPYVLLGLLVSKKPGEKWQIVCLIAYYGLYMVSGSRSSVFSAIPVFAYLWVSLFTKKSAKTQLLILVAALLALGALFSFISFARAFATSGGYSDIGALMAENNIFVDILQEAGQTFVATGALIERVPQVIQQTSGSTYLAGILYILPNGVTGNYYASVPSVDELVAPYLTSYGGVGSSFIAEGYLNFGPWCLILFFGYGLLIAWMANLADKELNKGNLMALFVVAACFLAFSFFIRSDVRTFLRTFLWDILPIIIVQQVFYTRLARGGKRDGGKDKNSPPAREARFAPRRVASSATSDSPVYRVADSGAYLKDD